MFVQGKLSITQFIGINADIYAHFRVGIVVEVSVPSNYNPGILSLKKDGYR